MKKYVLLFVFAFSVFANFAQEKEEEGVTTYYLIRHAEKNRAIKNDKDPVLTLKGAKRAKHWANVLANANINLIYSTDYNRTKETAQPLADKNGLQIYLYDPRKMYDEAFKYNTKGKNVLIVGHSNTTPAFVNKILGKNKYGQISDDNNSNLYIVTVTKSGATSVVLKIDH
ncbi:MAG: histidine phosphatase family protein [Flavobacteriaceae bacterium]|nr:histidine phosphatase family protein [Flavobacteriaceae bacterium]